MTIARQADASLIKPVGQFIIRRFVAAAILEAGQPVYLDSNGKAALCKADAVATNFAVGVAIQDVAAGATVDVCTLGAVEGIATGATPGKIIFTSDTEGAFAEAAGTKSTVLGVAETASRIYIRPAMVAFA